MAARFMVMFAGRAVLMIIRLLMTRPMCRTITRLSMIMFSTFIFFMMFRRLVDRPHTFQRRKDQLVDGEPRCRKHPHHFITVFLMHMPFFFQPMGARKAAADLQSGALRHGGAYHHFHRSGKNTPFAGLYL